MNPSPTILPQTNGNGSTAETQWVTKPELAQRLKLSIRSVDNLMARRVIPFVKMSQRCVRFNLTHVHEALAALEINAVKRNGNHHLM